jgi:SOS-response transcriptional repressor LexA
MPNRAKGKWLIMHKEITYKQKLVLDVLVLYIEETGYSPSIRELEQRVELASSVTVKAYLDVLRRKGYVDWEDGKARKTLHMIKKNDRFLNDDNFDPVTTIRI